MSAWQEFLQSIQSRLAALKSADCADPYFRGHASRNWMLEPGLARHCRDNPRFNPNKEARLYWAFRMRGSHLLPNGISEWTVLYYMQHFGIPTRLLDWTTSFATALYFAIRHKPESPCVWILDPYSLNNQTQGVRSISNMNVSFKMDYIQFLNLASKPLGALATDGDSSVERIKSQGGCFTVHGDLSVPLDRTYPATVTCHELPMAAVAEARLFLELAGANEYSIFPDLSGLAKDINSKELGTS